MTTGENDFCSFGVAVSSAEFRRRFHYFPELATTPARDAAYPHHARKPMTAISRRPAQHLSTDVAINYCRQPLEAPPEEEPGGASIIVL